MGGGCLPALACLFSHATASVSLAPSYDAALPATFVGSRGDEGCTDGIQGPPGFC